MTVLAEASGAFSFWLRITSEERGKCPRCAADFLYVDVIAESGTFTLATFDNRREGEYLQRFANLSGFKGQTIAIRFSTQQDSDRPTIFDIDDVLLR